MDEFALIQHYFKQQASGDASVQQGIGDDCAIVQPLPGKLLAISMDTLVAGIHFPQQTSAYDIGYKALAVNLSDLAAMAATPQWFTLSLSLPESNPEWLQAFARGLFDCAKKYSIHLIGGDTVRASLSITIQIQGYCSPEQVLYRHGAQPGDTIFVSDYTGEAAAGLLAIKQKQDMPYLVGKLNRPEPQIKLAQMIQPYCSACIDISDGLAADLGHILSASHCGAELEIEGLMANPNLQHLDRQEREKVILYGGDDYQLCFCVRAEQLEQFQREIWQKQPQIQKIGQICAKQQLLLKTPSGCRTLAITGYNHFG